MRYLLVLMVFSVISMASCQSSTNTTETGKGDVINQVISCADFDAKMKEGTVQLVDVRTPGEFSAGALEGAVNIDYNGSRFQEEIGKLDKEQPVFLYCRSGGRSAKSAAVLKDMGFKEVYDMEGGYTAWERYTAE